MLFNVKYDVQEDRLEHVCTCPEIRAGGQTDIYWVQRCVSVNGRVWNGVGTGGGISSRLNVKLHTDCKGVLVYPST